MQIDHIDLRVKNLNAAIEFYKVLMPALGFDQAGAWDNWYCFESIQIGQELQSFIGIVEDPNHTPDANRIAFRVENPVAVDRVASMIGHLASNFEAPGWCPEYGEGYYATFFEDPSGNKLEVCSRKFNIFHQHS